MKKELFLVIIPILLMLGTALAQETYMGDICSLKSVTCPIDSKFCDVRLFYKQTQVVSISINSGKNVTLNYCPTSLIKLKFYRIDDIVSPPTTTTTSTTTTSTSTTIIIPKPYNKYPVVDFSNTTEIFNIHKFCSKTTVGQKAECLFKVQITNNPIFVNVYVSAMGYGDKDGDRRREAEDFGHRVHVLKMSTGSWELIQSMDGHCYNEEMGYCHMTSQLVNVSNYLDANNYMNIRISTPIPASSGWESEVEVDRLIVSEYV